MAEPLVLEQLPQKVNLKLYRGDDFPIRMRWWSDENKTALADLSGASGRMKVLDAEGVELTELSTANGKIQLLDGSVLAVTDYNFIITFPKTDTAAYTWESGEYDYEHTDALGVTRTFFSGTILVIPDRTV